jgi:hypothetical protein
MYAVDGLFDPFLGFVLEVAEGLLAERKISSPRVAMLALSLSSLFMVLDRDGGTYELVFGPGCRGVSYGSRIARTTTEKCPYVVTC